MGEHYILDDDNKVIEEPDVLAWAVWLEAARKSRRTIVQQDSIPGVYFISTVFLGLDHSMYGDPSLLFETMIFNKGGLDDEVDGYQCRYSTWTEALAGHDQALALANDHLLYRENTNVE